MNKNNRSIENRKVIGTYDFVPEYNRWVNMSEQRKIVKKLENITKNEIKRDF